MCNNIPYDKSHNLYGRGPSVSEQLNAGGYIFAMVNLLTYGKGGPQGSMM